MRTTLDIDDELLKALMARHPGVSTREAVEIAIRQYVTDVTSRRVRRRAGGFEIEDVSGERKKDRRA